MESTNTGSIHSPSISPSISPLSSSHISSISSSISQDSSSHLNLPTFLDPTSGKVFRFYKYFDYEVIEDVEAHLFNAGKFARNIFKTRKTSRKFMEFKQTEDYKIVLEGYREACKSRVNGWGGYPDDLAKRCLASYNQVDNIDQVTDDELDKHLFTVYTSGYGNDVKGTYVPFRVFQLVALWADHHHKLTILSLLESINNKALAEQKSAYSVLEEENKRLKSELEEYIHRDITSNYSSKRKYNRIY